MRRFVGPVLYPAPSGRPSRRLAGSPPMLTALPAPARISVPGCGKGGIGSGRLRRGAVRARMSPSGRPRADWPDRPRRGPHCRLRPAYRLPAAARAAPVPAGCGTVRLGHGCRHQVAPSPTGRIAPDADRIAGSGPHIGSRLRQGRRRLWTGAARCGLGTDAAIRLPPRRLAGSPPTRTALPAPARISVPGCGEGGAGSARLRRGAARARMPPSGRRRAASVSPRMGPAARL